MEFVDRYVLIVSILSTCTLALGQESSQFYMYSVPLQKCNNSRDGTLYQALLAQPESETRYFCVPTNMTSSTTTPSTTYALTTYNFYTVNFTESTTSPLAATLMYNTTTGEPIPSLETSCVREADGSTSGKIIEIRTDGGPFCDLVNREIYLRVDGDLYLFRHFATGLHQVSSSTELPVPTNFTIHQISAVRFLSVLVLRNGRPLAPASSSSYRVCEHTTNGQYKATPFKVNERTERVCETFRELRENSVLLLYELQLALMNDGIRLEDGKCYNLVVTTVSRCEDLQQMELECSVLLQGGLTEYVSTEFTVCNVGVGPTSTDTSTGPTATPSETSTTTATDNPGGRGGVGGGVIAGIVIGLVLAIIIVAAVGGVITWKMYERYAKNPTGGPRNVETPDGPAERETAATPLTHRPTDTPVHLSLPSHEFIYVWNVTSQLDMKEVCDVLATEDGIHEWKPLLEITQDGQTHQQQQLTGIVRSQLCHRLYVVYEESPEWLKEHNKTAWKFMSAFQTRGMSDDILNKVVLVRVYEKKNGDTLSETVEGPLLTVNLTKRSWQNEPKMCASLILSKVRVGNNILTEDASRGYVHSTTPPSESPVVTSVQLHPESAPPPSYAPPQPTTDDRIHDVLTELTVVMKDISKNTGKTAENTGKIKENTKRTAEDTKDTKEVLNDIHDMVHKNEIDAEAPNNV